MNRFTSQQRFDIVVAYYENQRSIKKTQRALRPTFGVNNVPGERAIRRVVDKFTSQHTCVDTVNTRNHYRVRTAEVVAAVADSVEEDPDLSIRRRAQAVGLCASTLWKILRKDHSLKAYKIQLVQELKPLDPLLRRQFGEWAENELEVDPLFYRKILFSDEAHFWLNGYVNKQNCRIWSEDNPRQILETPLHPEKCTVWCALWTGGIIGPYFFKDGAGRRVTVNGERYRGMIRDYFVQNLDGLDVEEMWFQQDGATCHTSGVTIDLLKETFGERIISRNGPVNWPPRSCDLTPLDFFLWGYVKSKVYEDKPETIDALEQNIIRVIANIPAVMLEKVVENWTLRVRQLRRSRGQHLHDIIFKQ